MDRREMEYLIVIAQEKNLSKAAERLYVSQPALSRFLLKMENSIGMPLFERKKRQLVPTMAGELCLDTARKMLQLDQDLERKLTLEENVQAPVSAGQELGSVELSRNGTVYVSVPLVALNDVEASKLLTFWFNVREFFSRTSVRVALIVIGLLILAGVLWKLTMGRRRYRYGRPARRTRGYRGRRR